MDKTNFTSDVLHALENGLYLNCNSAVSISNVRTKILDFSSFLNSVGRLSLIQCDKSECDEFISLLLMLKKNIKYALSEIGHFHTKRKYNYVCCECEETIGVNPEQNFWTSLQDHEHIEHLYVKFLNGNLDTLTQKMANISLEPVAGTSNYEYSNENGDSGIDNEICDGDSNEISNFTQKTESNSSEKHEEGVNSFRFNFALRYDEAVETKIYPDRWIKTIRKIDKIKEYSIQKTGPFRVVCLLCCCELVVKAKISKFAVEDHVIGQRHFKNTTNSENLINLQRYHELFLSLEGSYQAHQVYFKPVSSAVKCVLCNINVKYDEVVMHIQMDPHKNKVLDLLEKKSNVFYLLETQVHVYGITIPKPETKEKDVKKEKMVVKTKVQTEKNDSDSSPSSDSKEAKHNIIKSVENPASENLLDLIPNRFREHLKYLKDNASVITCDLCKITFPKDIDKVKKHIRKSSHLKASNIKEKKYNYYCEICNIRIADETSWNTHFTDGPNRHANMAESRKEKTTEYECTKCCTVIYGDDLSLIRHLSLNSRRDKRSKEVKLPEPVKKLFRSKEEIENMASKLAFEANDTLRYNRLTTECCQRLEATLGVVFDGCKAYPFGSRVSGLGDQYSDLDVFIDTGGMYTGYKSQDALVQVQLVRRAASTLGKHKDEFQEVFQIPTARTPIVKLYHKPTEIECDLSFRHGLSVENTKFLRFCLDLQPVAQPFILILKKWSQHNKFSEHISTYALALMAIFFLQINNHLLSVKKLRELNPRESIVINGWQTIKYTMPLEVMQSCIDPYPRSISDLLKEFFGYYAKFKYSEEVICPLLGHTILKKQFFDGTLPEEMKSYLVQLEGEEPEQFRAMSSMCIQDPFDLSHNLTKACQPGTLHKFKTVCDLSFKRLESLV